MKVGGTRVALNGASSGEGANKLKEPEELFRPKGQYMSIRVYRWSALHYFSLEDAFTGPGSGEKNAEAEDMLREGKSRVYHRSG